MELGKSQPLTNALRELGANLLPKDGEARLAKGFFTKVLSENYLSVLLGSTSWRQDEIRLFGRTVLQPRLTAWMGDPGATYRYSGLLMRPVPWSPVMLEIKAAIETRLGKSFNSALLNFYRDGLDSMGWHRDNEPELGPTPTIVSISFGASRRFKIRHYFDKKPVFDLLLENGDLLVMGGVMQSFWEHCLPKTRPLQEARLNITFRSVDIPSNQV